MSPAEVLAVEVPQFVGGDGALRMLVPRIIGQSEEIRANARGKIRRPSAQVDDETYFRAVPPELRETVANISELAVSHGYRVERRLTATGAASARLYVAEGGSWPITIARDGVWIDLGYACPQLREPATNARLRHAILKMDPKHPTVNDPRKTYTVVKYSMLQRPERRRALAELFSIIRRATGENVAT
jgi:hypothetical protein